MKLLLLLLLIFSPAFAAYQNEVNVGNFPATQAVTQSGTWNINNISGVISLPSGAATSANQSTSNGYLLSIDGKLPTLVSGRIPVDGSGVTQPVSGTVTANIGTIAGVATETTLSSILGFVDQLEGYLDGVEASLTSIINNTTGLSLQSGSNTFLDKTSSGVITLTVVDSLVSISPNGSASVGVQITGTWSGTLQYECTLNGTDYFSISSLPYSSTGAATTSTTGNTQARFAVSTCSTFRVRRSAGTSGTANVTIISSSGESITWAFSQNANNFITAAAQTGTWNITNVSGTVSLPTGASTAANQVTAQDSFTSIDNKITTSTSAPTDSASGIVVRPLQLEKQTYSATAVGLGPGAASTDFFTITGSASKTVKIISIIATATQNTAAAVDVLLIKRSTDNTGGTSTTLTNIPYDSTNSASTAVVRSYTVNPTLGTTVGTIYTEKLFIPTTTGDPGQIRLMFSENKQTPIILRGVNEVLSLNLNANGLAGDSWDITVVWTEE